MQQTDLFERQKIASALAGFIFMAAVPGIIFAMIPKIDSSVGWQILGFSLLLGMTIFVWGFTPHHLRDWRLKMGPAGLMIGGLVLYGIGAIWYYRAHASLDTNNGPTLVNSTSPPIPEKSSPPQEIKWYSPAEANGLIDALHKDEDLILKLTGVIQPAIQILNPRFFPQMFDTPAPNFGDPKQQYVGRLNYLLNELNNIQSSISSTRDQMNQTHNAMGWSISKEIFGVLTSLDDPGIPGPLNEYKTAISLLRDFGDTSKLIGTLAPQNQRFVEALILYERQVESAIADIRSKIDTIRRSVQSNTGDDLIFRAQDLADQLRIFDVRQSEIERSTLDARQKIVPTMSEDEKTRIWKENTEQMIALRNNWVIEFRNRFKLEILRVRDQLLFKIKMEGKVPPEPSDAVTRTLDQNILAGADPLTRVADYLDALANLAR